MKFCFLFSTHFIPLGTNLIEPMFINFIVWFWVPRYRRCECRTLRGRANGFMPVISTFIMRFGWNSL